VNGEVCVITGGTSGIGRATALGLARQGAKIVIVARNAAKAAAVVAEIGKLPGTDAAAVVIADLTEMAEVRRAAEEIDDRFGRVDVLINNAAGMFDTYGESSNGIERTYAINHLATFLLTLALHESLKKARQPRVIIVSSNLQKAGYVADYFSLVRPRFEWSRVYAQTKLRNLIFARTLSKRWEGDGITVNSLHPGVVNTGLMSGWENRVMKAVFAVVQRLFLSPEKGARTSIFLASDPSVAAVTGAYFVKSRPHPHNPVADDTAVQQQTWSQAVARLAEAGITLTEAVAKA
jgi:NAD(P)-dependent dehydrogenase (short-subunit alcohol dehydrogenase family)